MTYRKIKKDIFLIIFTPLFFSAKNTVIIQVKTEKEEDKEVQIGIGAELNFYAEFSGIIKNIKKDVKFSQFIY